MREIAVECDQPVEAHPVSVRDAGEMSASDAELPLAVNNRQPLVLCCERIEDHARSIGRVIVEKNQVGVDRQRQQLRDHILDIVALIISRNEDELPELQGFSSAARTRSVTISAKETLGRHSVFFRSFEASPQSG